MDKQFDARKLRFIMWELLYCADGVYSTAGFVLMTRLVEKLQGSDCDVGDDVLRLDVAGLLD
jgi:hypothetical protein